MNYVNTFSIDQINHQVRRILNSPAFKNSSTLSKFLEFIIAEKINDRDQYIKEYSVAVNVLNRPPSFNPRDDAVVRIHGGRLRRALNDFYLDQGINDPIVIQVPKGSYIPQFNARTTLKLDGADVFPEAGIIPTVAIFPFRTTLQKPDVDEFSLTLREQLGAELSRFKDISVIGYYSTEMTERIEQNILEAGKSLRADYIITGSVQYSSHGDRVRINLLVTATGEVILTKSFDVNGSATEIPEIQDEIVQSVIAVVGGYYGVIFQEMAKASPAKVTNNSPVYEGIYSYYKYQQSFSVENCTSAVSALQQAVDAYPNHAASWAMLGELYLKATGLKIITINNPFKEGYKCIVECLKIDPLCQHGWLALSWYYLFTKEKKACLETVRQCIQLNPNNSIVVCSAACILICAGCFDEGFPIMEKAAKFNPYHPWWVNGGFCFYYLHKKEYTTALSWIEKMNSEGNYWDPLLKSVCFSYMDNMEEAEKHLAKLLSMEPETPGEIRALVSTFLLPEELITNIIDGIEKIDFKASFGPINHLQIA